MKVTNKQHTRKKNTRQKTKKTQTRKLNMFLYWKCKGLFMHLGGVFLSLWLSPPWAQIYSYRGTWQERIETGLSLPPSHASSLPWAHWTAAAWAEDSFHKDGLLAIYSVSFQEIPEFSPLLGSVSSPRLCSSPRLVALRRLCWEHVQSSGWS